MGYVVIESPVEIDMATADKLRAQILANDPTHTIVVDMTRVTFCDSTGLAVLIAGREHTESGSGRLILRNPPEAMRRLLAITRLEHVFEIEGPADAPS